MPALKIIESNTQDIFISLNQISNSECSEKINDALQNKFTIEEYLETFTKNVKTKYAKKKPLLIIEDSDEENQTAPIHENTHIIEGTAPISLEKVNINEQTKTKKNKDKNIKEKKTKTKKTNIPKTKLIIEE